MSDESDDTGGGTLVHGPWSGDSTYTLPPIPDFIDTIPPPGVIPEVPPESPEETTMELPAIPAAPNPATALRSEGIIASETDEDESEYQEGEYEQLRSLADRLGDWLEYRLETARYNRESEAPFREAEIARKVALLEGRTAQEVAMMEQNGKLHAAMMRAKGDKAAARGKADADRAKSSSLGSGLGADKGRSKAGGGGGSRSGGGSSGGSGRSGSGGSRAPGTNGSAGAGRGSGGGSSPKGSGKGSERSSGGRGGPSKGNDSSGGSRSRQNGSGGSGGSGKSGSGRGSSSGSGGKNAPGTSGGSGKGGSKDDGSGRGGSKGDGGTQNAPVSPRAERSRGRQERAAARQAARHQRRSADQAARIADRSKDRDQDRVAGQAAREERRRVKAERQAARRAKREARREAAGTADGRTTLGAAVTQEARRRWEKRRAAENDTAEKDTAEKESTSGKNSEATDRKKTKDGPGPAADGPKDDPPTGKGTDSSDKDRTDSSKGEDEGGWGWWKKKPAPDSAAPDGDEPRSAAGGNAQPGDGDPYEDLFGQDDPQYTTDRPDRPDTGPESRRRHDAAAPGAGADDDVVDAVIVDDPGDPFGADRIHQAGLTTGTPGLPPAPEKHTQRPGTSRPASTSTSTEGDSVSSAPVSKPSGGGGGLAAQHRTDITFGEYLTEMANIAVKAASDQERAEMLTEALGKVADVLREMVADLVGDHNISTAVTNLISDLADAAGRMKAQALRCAEQCGLAKEAAVLASVQVVRVYGRDMAAKEDAGLQHVSAAAHHD
ncbi:ATP/GTP-binding protein [Streptomyces anulatus]|uniref:ATP/GTP-binding protein n=1 Tax=Streptomyces anulatus TaxID=1892 RepID=UPI003438B55E